MTYGASVKKFDEEWIKWWSAGAGHLLPHHSFSLSIHFLPQAEVNSFHSWMEWLLTRVPQFHFNLLLSFVRGVSALHFSNKFKVHSFNLFKQSFQHSSQSFLFWKWWMNCFYKLISMQWSERIATAITHNQINCLKFILFINKLNLFLKFIHFTINFWLWKELTEESYYNSIYLVDCNKNIETIMK